MKKTNSRGKRPIKYESKYLLKYGYSTIDIQKILGWSLGKINYSFRNKELRNEMLLLAREQNQYYF